MFGCGERKRLGDKPTPTDWSLRQKLSDGKPLSLTERNRLTDKFAEEISGLTVPIAKNCRVQVYLKSLHFSENYEGGFDGNFEMRDRGQGETNQLSITYEAYNSVVRSGEKAEKRAELGSAPEAVKRQVLAEGDFYTNPVALARCAFEDIPFEDISLPYFDIHCEETETNQERFAQERTLESVNAICADLWENYLNHGEVDVELIIESHKH